MNKIRIIDLALQQAKLQLPNTLINLSVIRGNNKKQNWCKILKAMQELETIFAIPPIILTPYIHQERLTLEELYTAINPMTTTLDHDELYKYILELKTIINIKVYYQDRETIGDNLFDHTNNILLHNRIATYQIYLKKTTPLREPQTT